MGRRQWWASVAGIWTAGAVLHASGCVFPVGLDDCALYPGNGCGTGTGAADGGTPTGCVPRMVKGAVADSCGVFVSPSGDDGNAGTKEKPLKTITAALGKGATVYVCAGAMPYPEALIISKGVALYGALDCTSWAYSAATKTQLASAADSVPLSLASAAGGTEVHDFLITAADASVPGGSSIAVLVDQASVLLQNVDANAGSGAPGAAGAVQAQVMTPATANGSDGTDDPMCNMAGVLGGAGGKNTCGTTDTSGGLGGTGAAATSGGPGGGGNPMMTPTNAGSGQTATMQCTPGQPGAQGTAGTVGIGARGAGDISASGYQGPTGAPGTSGTPGQGGGGGGGARQCDMGGMYAGPSAGGGGAGGCSGAPGNVGQSGGSSIGILAIGAQVALMSTSISTRTGGAGGTGGDGQMGGNGGLSGHAVGGAACDGGKGGQGGAGGPGGGGAGGHSIAVAIKGGTLPDLSTTTIIPGTAGTGGLGGDMDMTAQTKGDDGMACKTLDFTNPMSCAM